MALQEVTIVKDHTFGSKVLVDGVELKNVRNLDLHMDNESIPSLKVELYAMPQAEFTAQVEVNYMPKTLQEASKIVVESIKSNPGFRDSMIASIVGVLREYNLPFLPEDELAKHILNRIIGEE